MWWYLRLCSLKTVIVAIRTVSFGVTNQLVNDDVFLCKEKLFGKTLDGRGLKLLFLKKNPVIGFNAVCFSGMGFRIAVHKRNRLIGFLSLCV